MMNSVIYLLKVLPANINFVKGNYSDNGSLSPKIITHYHILADKY